MTPQGIQLVTQVSWLLNSFLEELKKSEKYVDKSIICNTIEYILDVKEIMHSRDVYKRLRIYIHYTFYLKYIQTDACKYSPLIEGGICNLLPKYLNRNDTTRNTSRKRGIANNR